MSLFNGEKIKVEIYGESHAPEIGVKCSGFPKMQIDLEKLSAFMDRRKPSSGKFSTARKEPDQVEFTLGVTDGKIVDGTFNARIVNKDTRSGDYADLYGKPRPSHADYCAYKKFGTLDFRGGGKFSARLTAPLCIAGGIAKQYLENMGVRIYAYLQSVANIEGKSYKQGVTEDEIKSMRGFPALTSGDKMLAEIERAKLDLDSVGGICECIVYGAPVGIGDSYFGGLEGKIAQSIYAIPAVKGVEFGAGFDISKMHGSTANDAFYFDNGIVKTKTNNSGGLNGGITNGMPITMRVAFRPTPSIAKEQNTVDLVNETNAVIKIKGRHDSCVAVRALPVVESAVALAIIDALDF